jgi:nicotinate-nucleotide adenylyltransferase
VSVGGFPGTFNPPTVAHLAVAEAAWRQCSLDRVELVVSRRALGKDDPPGPSFAHRLAVLEQVVATRPWLGLEVTEARLIADVAAGYDAVVLGADKWAQVMDPEWYDGSRQARDDALRRLPRVVVAPRGDFPPPPSATLLDVESLHLSVSSTAARLGRLEWMLPEAAAFDEATGAWTDLDRYTRWARSQVGGVSSRSGGAGARTDPADRPIVEG